MFREQTVIIVGAGASAEFGISTGLSIFKSALQLQEPRIHQGVIGFAFQHGFKWYLEGQKNPELARKYPAFKKRVQSSFSPSIDRLAWLNEDIADVCRAFSSYAILKDLYIENAHHNAEMTNPEVWFQYRKRKDHLGAFVGNAPNWIGRCVDKWIGDASGPEDTDPNVLTFVTFNYDLLIEEAFSNFVSTPHRYKSAEPMRLPNVFHVHGAFDGYPDELTTDYMLRCQRAIKYIEDGGDIEAVRRSKIRLEQAQHIIAVGFDFDEKNVSLLGLRDVSYKIHALNFDGNAALQNRLLQIGVLPKNILSGTNSSRLGLSVAAQQGLFDRPEVLSKLS